MYAMFIWFLLLFLIGIVGLNGIEPKAAALFGICDLMVFVFLWAVCFSQVSVLPFDSSHISSSKYLAVPFAWIVLMLFYARNRLFASILAHCGGILASCYFTFFAWLDLGVPCPWSELRKRVLAGMILGSFAGLLFFSIKRTLALFYRSSSS
jgi:hypothetical protein